MKKEILNKEIAEKLMKIEGGVRGLILKCDGEYILKEKGEGELEKLEKELARLGCPIKYREIKDLDFYPVGLRAISLLAMKKVFGFNDDKIREVGALHPKAPLAARFFMSYIFSIPAIMKRSQKMWRRYISIGELTFVEFNEKEKYAVLEIRGYDIHPITCRVEEGHIAALAEMVLKVPKATCRETKCTFEGQDCHQFKVTWK